MTEHFIAVFLTVTRLTYFESVFTRQDMITTCSLVFVFVFALVFFIVRYLATSWSIQAKNNSMASNLFPHISHDQNCYRKSNDWG